MIPMSYSSEKPLFIPLAREWFEKFKRGDRLLDPLRSPRLLKKKSRSLLGRLFLFLKLPSLTTRL